MTTTEKENKIKKYLQEQDTEQARDLDLCIMNDYKYYSILKKLFDHEYKELKRFKTIADQIEALDEEISKLSDDELKEYTQENELQEENNSLKR